ncbi:magnesium transporter [Salinarimonas sp.]|uniref:magnesium transporter n=1 Tax=Salinarimonas sp. TaxID=2766526 RepID=UPI0039195F78
MNDVVDKTRDLAELEVDTDALHEEATHEATLDVVADAIRTALAAGDTATIRAFLESHETADVATMLDHLESADALAAMRALELRDRANVFGYLAPGCQVDIAELMGRHDLARLMSAMSHDERADLYKRLDPVAQEAILPGLAKAEREDLRKLASYEEGTVGAIMTSDYATLSPDMTVPEAIDALRHQAIEAETVYQAYIVDEERRLVGVVSLRDLLMARPRARVRDLMDTDPVWIHATDKREEAAQLVSRYDLMAIPVINGGDRLVGIVTQDDAMDVQEEEATTDFQKVGSVQNLRGSVREAGIFLLYRARIVWLILLVFGNILSGAGIAIFEDTIAAYVALVFFLPVLIGSGGNAGSQAATLTVRALATGDVRMKDWGWMIGRELVVALFLGVTMALAISGIGLYRGGAELALVVALAMVSIVVLGSLIGMSLPFVLSKLKMDPATASAPLVTSIADVVGVLIYFTIATQLLPMPEG